MKYSKKNLIIRSMLFSLTLMASLFYTNNADSMISYVGYEEPCYFSRPHYCGGYDYFCSPVVYRPVYRQVIVEEPAPRVGFGFSFGVSKKRKKRRHRHRHHHHHHSRRRSSSSFLFGFGF